MFLEHAEPSSSSFNVQGLLGISTLFVLKLNLSIMNENL